jgi:hypothetical protein
MIEQSERSRHLIEVSRRAMHRGHDAWAAFNLSDKVTVALVLNRADWLEEFGCTLTIFMRILPPLPMSSRA